MRQVEIKAIVVSHPDYDHYNGLTAILKDTRFKVGHIYHNGIIRYDYDNIPPGRNFDLGRTRRRNIAGQNKLVLNETFNSLSQVGTLN